MKAPFKAVHAILIALAAVQSASLHADTNVGTTSPKFRASFSLGPWTSWFSQTDSTHKSEFNTLPWAGLNATAGVDLSFFFIEYNFAWLMEHGTVFGDNRPPHILASSYFSYIGANFGVSLPFAPFEVFGGYENAHYSLPAGPDVTYYGGSLKVGVSAFLPSEGSKTSFGLRVEYRRSYLWDDNMGEIPSSISTHADSLFVGFTIRLQSSSTDKSSGPRTEEKMPTPPAALESPLEPQSPAAEAPGM